MNCNSFSFRVRYEETDQMQVVYHGNYAKYLEIGRVEWLRAIGITYRSMEETGTILPVVFLQINYLKPAKYDDLITIETILKKTPVVKIEFDYKIYSDSGELLAVANTVLAFLDRATGKPKKCPDYILEKLS